MENSEAKPEGLLKKIGRVGLLAGLIFNTGSKNTEKPFIEINTDQKANSEKFQDNSSIGCEIVATPGRETYAPISVLDDKNQLENCLTPIKNETTTGTINIDPEILILMEENIKASGLEGAVNKIIIRDLNDPVFKNSETAKRYGSMASGLIGAAAFVQLDFDQEKNVYLLNIYLSNGGVAKETVLHEIGHIPDWIRYSRQYPNQLPDRFNQIDFSDPALENNYHQRFVNYMKGIPSGELAPFTVGYEKTIVMGKSLELGKMLWSNFQADFTDSIEGATPFYIPKDKLPEAKSKLLSKLYQDAVEWLIEGLAKEEAEGKTRMAGAGFFNETLGRFLMYSYYYNPDKLKTALPTALFDTIEKGMLETEAIAGSEMWADMWSLRVLDREKAFALDPETVLAQENLVNLLR